MPTASSVRPHSPNSAQAGAQRIWTAGRVLSIVGLGLVPTVVVLLQPSASVLWGALAVEVLLAVVAVKEWLLIQA